MTGVAERHRVGRGLERGDRDRGEGRRPERPGEAVDHLERGDRVRAAEERGPQGAAQLSHDRRRGQTLADHVTDGHEHPTAVDDEVVPVAADEHR